VAPDDNFDPVIRSRDRARASRERSSATLSPVSVFERPTLGALARYSKAHDPVRFRRGRVRQRLRVRARRRGASGRPLMDIRPGMAVRARGPRRQRAVDNLEAGRESISRFRSTS
jgi:hypothetical protein